jgi:phosphotransferase system enzyme I (PtsI)
MVSTKSWRTGSNRPLIPLDIEGAVTGASRSVLGIGAAPGRAMGVVRRVSWDIARTEHRTISADEVEQEIERFDEARAWARERIEKVRAETAQELGEIEAMIFDPQILMLDDPDLVNGTISYIRDNYLSADRAFDWRLLELRSQAVDVAHLMIVDRLADIQDVRFRVLSQLQGTGSDPFALPEERAILVFEELTPSVAVRLDPELVLGLITAGGSRTAHSAVLARSMGIPAVVGVGSSLSELEEGSTVLLDGGTGSIVIDPTGSEIEAHVRMVERITEWSQRTTELAGQPTSTVDASRVWLRANLDQPDDVDAARRAGAEGVGLFRSEFLVIGRRVIPSEEEQYQAYRRVVQAFPEDPVTLRTFDIGGDKFPLFLEMPPEENPYLGWRAIRICLDLPDLFRNQLRAAARAASDGELRILLPFVTNLDEIRRTRTILDEVLGGLAGSAPEHVALGVMVETPAIVEMLDLISEHVDFISLGTNDLTQYVLAVDRGNARMSHLADPFHPAMLRVYAKVRAEASKHGIDLAVCGDLSADPAGIALLLGLGYRDFSLPPSSIPEAREVVRSVSCNELEKICRSLDVDAIGTLKTRLSDYLGEALPFETATVAR